jgi:tetratricopeptide (TPR) repeat protein
LKNKQYDDALKLFQKAIDLDSENSEAAESLKAVESFLAKKKSQTKDTQYSDILTNRGVQLMEEEKYEDAISLFERAIQNNPQNTIAIRKRKEAIREHQKQKENGENENTAWLFASEDSSPPSPTIEKTENPLVDGSETTTERVEESLPPKTTEEGDSSENLEKINEILVSEGKRETEEYDKCDGKIREGTIGVDFYEGVTLDQKLPVQFQLGEYIQISGKVEGGTKM